MDEVAKALKTCVGDASRVVAESEKSSARAAHLRSRASQAQKVYDATLAAEELSAQWVEMEIMLGRIRHLELERSSRARWVRACTPRWSSVAIRSRSSLTISK